MAVGEIPSRFRYAVLGWGPVTRVWLVDLEARVAPRLVIRLEHMGNGEITASRNGDVMVLSAPGAHAHRAVHVVRPTTGVRTVIHDEPGAQVGGTPIVTPAGDRYAFAKQIPGVNGFPGIAGRMRLEGARRGWSATWSPSCILRERRPAARLY